MGAFSELFAEELEAHDDPLLLIFTIDETSLIVFRIEFKKISHSEADVRLSR